MRPRRPELVAVLVLQAEDQTTSALWASGRTDAALLTLDLMYSRIASASSTALQHFACD